MKDTSADSRPGCRTVARRLGRPYKLRAIAIVAFACLLGPARSPAMSVQPPAFEELVDESARIVRGRVVQVDVFRAPTPDGGTLIKTRVTWKLSRVLKGADATACTLEFLGGRIGTDQMLVPGMPAFVVGDDDYLFIEPDERTLCPLLAAGHGRYRVRQDAATQRAFVARDNDAVLVSTDDVSLPLAAITARRDPAAGLSPEAFEERIVATLRRTPSSSHDNR